MKLLLVFGIAFATFHISYSVPAFCNLPHDEGHGMDFIFASYYDPDTDLCYPFLYKGEGGNENRFEHERECIRNCSTRAEEIYPIDEAAPGQFQASSNSNTPPSGGKATAHDTEKPERKKTSLYKKTQACHFQHMKGQCSGQYLRYYYDSVHDKCKKFLYTGCVGNGNRFFDQASCNATCDGIHDDREAEEEDEPDTPVALICGVVFGVVGAIIIIVVIALTIQSSGKSEKEPRKTKEKQTESPLQEQGIEMA